MRLRQRAAGLVMLLALLPRPMRARELPGRGPSPGSLAPGILQLVVRHVYPVPDPAPEAHLSERTPATPWVRSSGALSGRLQPTAAAAAARSSAYRSSAYRADPAVSAAVKAAFLRGVRLRSSPAAAAAIATSLESSDPVAQWNAMVERQGLHAGDLADALASYWVLNWAMANRAESSAAAMQAVRDQVRWVVASKPDLRQLSDAEKQAMAEEAMLNFIYEVSGYLQARRAGNTLMLGRFAEGAEMRFLKELSVDLRSVHLSDRGLDARR